MRLRHLLCLVAVCGLSVACASKKKADIKEDSAKVTQKTEKKADNLVYACLVGKDLRTVELEKSEKRCEVHYTKFGEKNQVAWAEATPNICTRVKKQIRNNIESAGFKCGENLAEIQKERTTASK